MFDLLIRDVQIVNVFSGNIQEGDIAVMGDTLVSIAKQPNDSQARLTVEGKHRYALPGFIDSHMHIESSMMTPAHFAETVLPFGTTTVCADPHEITNVCGMEGLRAFTESAMGLPLHVCMAAPSTIPSAPGRERSGYDVTADEMAEMLEIPGICGMGEMMDFNGVADGDERILGVIEAARNKGVYLDGHVSILSGKRLEAFRATGIDADHTYLDPKAAEEKLSLGFAIQVQRAFFSRELMEFLNQYPVQNRIMLVTDDVPFIRLVREGQLNANVRLAVSMGLDPLKAIRYATINAADRLRLYDRGGLVPGRKADLQLLDNLTDFTPEMVFSDGKLVAEKGKCLVRLEGKAYPAEMKSSVLVTELKPEDFAISAGKKNAGIETPAAGSASDAASRREGCVSVRVAVNDGRTPRTLQEIRQLPVKEGFLDPEGFITMAVIYRHGYRTEETRNSGIGEGEDREKRSLPNEKRGQLKPGKEVSLGLLDLPERGAKSFHGAIATTYAHDSHNLVIYGSSREDMALAGNRLIALGGGLCAVQEGKILCEIPLPVAGLLSEERREVLEPLFSRFLQAVETIGLAHQDPMSFLTLMALAVSPALKVTDLGLLDTAAGEFVDLIV